MPTMTLSIAIIVLLSIATYINAISITEIQEKLHTASVDNYSKMRDNLPDFNFKINKRTANTEAAEGVTSQAREKLHGDISEIALFENVLKKEKKRSTVDSFEKIHQMLRGVKTENHNANSPVSGAAAVSRPFYAGALFINETCCQINCDHGSLNPHLYVLYGTNICVTVSGGSYGSFKYLYTLPGTVAREHYSDDDCASASIKSEVVLDVGSETGCKDGALFHLPYWNDYYPSPDLWFLTDNGWNGYTTRYCASSTDCSYDVPYMVQWHLRRDSVDPAVLTHCLPENLQTDDGGEDTSYITRSCTGSCGVTSTSTIYVSLTQFTDLTCTTPNKYFAFATNVCETVNGSDIIASRQYVYTSIDETSGALTIAYYQDADCATTSVYSEPWWTISDAGSCNEGSKFTVGGDLQVFASDGLSTVYFASSSECSGTIYHTHWAFRSSPVEIDTLADCVSVNNRSSSYFREICTGDCSPSPSSVPTILSATSPPSVSPATELPPPPVRTDNTADHNGPTGHGPHGNANGDMAKPAVMFSVTPYKSVNAMGNVNVEWHCLEFDYMSRALKTAHGTYNNLGYFEGAFMGNAAYVSYYENTLSPDGRMFYPTTGAGVISYDLSSYSFESGTYWAAGQTSLFPWAAGLTYCADCMPITAGWSIHDWVKLARRTCLWSPYDPAHSTADANINNIIFGPKGFQNVWESDGIGPFETNGSTIGAYTYTYSQEECDAFEQTGKFSCAAGNLELGHYQLNAVSAIVGHNRVFVSLWNATTGPLQGQVGPVLGLFQTNTEEGSVYKMSQSEFNGIFCYLDTADNGMVSPTGCTPQVSRFKRRDRGVAKSLMSAYDSYRSDKVSHIQNFKWLVDMIFGN